MHLVPQFLSNTSCNLKMILQAALSESLCLHPNQKDLVRELVKDLKDLILAKQDFPEEVILDLTELEGIGVMGIQTILAVRENLMKNKSGLKLKMKEEIEPMLTWMGLNWLNEESSA